MRLAVAEGVVKRGLPSIAPGCFAMCTLALVGGKRGLVRQMAMKYFRLQPWMPILLECLTLLE